MSRLSQVRRGMLEFVDKPVEEAQAGEKGTLQRPGSSSVGLELGQGEDVLERG